MTGSRARMSAGVFFFVQVFAAINCIQLGTYPHKPRKKNLILQVFNH